MCGQARRSGLSMQLPSLLLSIPKPAGINTAVSLPLRASSRISPFPPFLQQGGFPTFAEHGFSLSEDPPPLKAGSQGNGTGPINGSGQPPVGTKPAHPSHPAALSRAHGAGRGAQRHTPAACRRNRLSCKKSLGFCCCCF